MSDSYRRHYGIGILDDIHNYFPQLLYDIDGFRNIQDVLVYVRNETARRFSGFDNARREFRMSRISSANRYLPQTRIINTIPDDILVPLTPLAPSAPLNDYSDLLTLLQGISSPPRTNIFSSFLTRYRAEPDEPLEEPVIPRLIQSLYEDVIVHANQETIDQASTRVTLTADLDVNCSVCQDRMKKDDSVRTLTVCSHQFHAECIDPWLLTRSTKCPSCRNDIRENVVNSDEEHIPEDFMSLLFNRRF